MICQISNRHPGEHAHKSWQILYTSRLCCCGNEGGCSNSRNLGKTFLATAGAIIDVKNGQLTLKVGEEEVKVNLFQVIRHKPNTNKCLRVDIIDELVEKGVR